MRKRSNLVPRHHGHSYGITALEENTMTEKLQSLHAKYCTLTGQELKYQPAERMLYDYLNNGFTEADLDTVLTFLIHQNKKREPRYRNKIQFHRIVGDLEFFNSIFGEASAWARNKRPAPTEKSLTLAAFRNEAPAVAPVGGERHIMEVFQTIGQNKP